MKKNLLFFLCYLPIYTIMAQTPSVELFVDAINGTAKGAGTFQLNDYVEIEAVPDDGYAFSYWSDFNTDNPRTIQLVQTTTTLTAVCLPIDEAVYDLCLADADELSVYFIKPDNWGSNINCYMWHYGTYDELTNPWPGNPAEAFSDRLYKFKIPADWGEQGSDWMIIWNDGSNQTEDHRYQNNAVFSIVEDVQYLHGNLTTINYVCTKVCPDAIVEVYDTICEGQTIYIRDESITYKEVGDYSFQRTLISSHGGDSIVNYHIKVRYSVADEKTYEDFLHNYNEYDLNGLTIIICETPDGYWEIYDNELFFFTSEWDRHPDNSPITGYNYSPKTYTNAENFLVGSEEYFVDFLDVEFSNVCENVIIPQLLIVFPCQHTYDTVYVDGDNNDITENIDIETINVDFEWLPETYNRYVVHKHLTYVIGEEWRVLQEINTYLIEHDWNNPWDLSGGYSSINTLHGLTIENNHITGIDLSNSGISGSFPTILFKLPHLTNINLSGNNLSGNIGQNLTDIVHGVTNINIAHNNFSGNIGLFASQLPDLVSLTASYNHFSELSPAFSEILAKADISHQSIEKTYTLDMTQAVDYNILSASQPQIITYSVADRNYRPVQIEMDDKNKSWYASLYVNDEYMDWSTQYGKNIYKLEYGDNIIATDNYSGSTFPLKLLFREGDANMDTHIDIADLQSVINYILGYLSDYRVFNFTAVDLWEDEIINIQDIIRLVDKLINSESTSSEIIAYDKRRISAFSTTSDAEVIVRDGKLILNSNMPVAAFDIIVYGTNNMIIANELERIGMTIITKALPYGFHIIGYSLTKTCLPIGTSVIGFLDTEISTVRNVILSDSEANYINVSYDEITTGITTSNNKETDKSIIYDMLGRKINTISNKGIYIVNGNKVIK